MLSVLFLQWRAGSDVSVNEFSKSEIERYSRHLIMPEVALEGQKKLKKASVLLVGMGGLGSPIFCPDNLTLS